MLATNCVPDVASVCSNSHDSVGSPHVSHQEHSGLGQLVQKPSQTNEAIIVGIILRIYTMIYFFKLEILKYISSTTFNLTQQQQQK